MILQTKEFIRGQWVVVPAKWRKYASWQESIDDHAAFLKQNPRYQPCFQCLTAEAFAQALAKACGMSFSKHGLAVVNVGGVGLYHYARILQRAKEDEVIPIPVACLTDRDVVPDAAKDYIDKPKNGNKRFDADYTPEELVALVKAKVDRAAGGKTIVCVSDRWTFEYDLARYGCGELIFMAIQLAVPTLSSPRVMADVPSVCGRYSASRLKCGLAASPCTHARPTRSGPSCWCSVQRTRPTSKGCATGLSFSDAWLMLAKM